MGIKYMCPSIKCMCPSVRSSVRPSVRPFVHPSGRPAVGLSVRPSVCLSVWSCLPVVRVCLPEFEHAYMHARVCACVHAYMPA